MTDLRLLGVSRWGDDEQTPVVVDDRSVCGSYAEHHRRGCIALHWTTGKGSYGLVHLTTEDALRLSDLLRAMAATNEAEVAGGG